MKYKIQNKKLNASLDTIRIKICKVFIVLSLKAL